MNFFDHFATILRRKIEYSKFAKKLNFIPMGGLQIKKTFSNFYISFLRPSTIFFF